MKSNILVHHPHQITQKWAQRILEHYAADAKVSDVNIQSINIGTTTRLKIKVNHDAPEVVPLNWFVKIPSLVLRSRLITALPRLLHKEVNFYKSLSVNTPLKLPPILAAQSQFGLGSTLVMADLAELGFQPGQTSDALSLEQAQKVVEHLAKFHSQFWEKPELLNTHRWLSGFNVSAENWLGSLLAVPLMKRGLSLADKLIADKLRKPALNYAANRRKIIKLLASGPQTLVHHDCHPGNFFWEGTTPGFLDWQLVRMGEGIGDIAYFLATSLTPQNRRAYENQLLKLYFTTLQAQGVADIDESGLYQRYRMHLTYPFEAMVITLALGNMMELNSNLELISRATSAIEDHDSFAALQLQS